MYYVYIMCTLYTDKKRMPRTNLPASVEIVNGRRDNNTRARERGPHEITLRPRRFGPQQDEQHSRPRGRFSECDPSVGRRVKVPFRPQLGGHSRAVGRAGVEPDELAVRMYCSDCCFGQDEKSS